MDNYKKFRISKLLIAFLGLAFVFTASAAFANLNFSNDLVNQGDMTIQSGNLFNSNIISFNSPDDYAIAAINSTSDGYAGAELNFTYTAQPGDVDYSGDPATPGDQYAMSLLVTQMVDTTDEDSTIAYFLLPTTPTYSWITDSYGNIALGFNGFTSPVTADDSNLFVAGDGSGTTIKGNTTVSELHLPTDSFDPGEGVYGIIKDEIGVGGLYVTSSTGGGAWNYQSPIYVVADNLGSNYLTLSHSAVFSTGDLTLRGSSGPTLILSSTAATVNGSLVTTTAKVAAITVGGLSTCNGAAKGVISYVTDANSTTFHTIAAGGGANNILVACDGTNWRIGG